MKDLDSIYFAARELPPEDRPAYLAEACGGDSALRLRVEQMLAVADEAEAFITDTPDAKDEERASGQGAPDEFVGQKIGRYKILERVGEGGCGVVYVAEQTEPVRRRVALKIIKLGMDTRQVVARFEAERQALAMMDHPNIARVIDAGATELGRPYFVMELVRGIRITDYCDQNNLPTQQRLDLFIKVCQAIQHAHQKGIIHRDIKPSNILVTLHDGVPVPKVIDFGIAKTTEGRLTEATVYTQLHQFIGTPAYISPEQAEMSGLDIDTRSDIYSLGVLLYELLTGSPPFDPKELIEAGIDQMRKTIREKEPVRPSTKLATLKGDALTTTARCRASEPPRLIHQLKGDLDWIVMKCLEKDRTRRYETSSGLAADLQRHLNNEPVVARPPSPIYEFQKLIRRHKAGFVAATALLVMLVAGTSISTWQAIRATQAKDAEVKQRIAAEKAEARAAAQQKRAEDQATRAEWLVYGSKLALAQSDFDTGNGGLALRYLSECQEKLRGWEWRYLWNRVNARLTLTGHVGSVQCVSFSADGRRLVTVSLDKTAKVWDAATGSQLITLKGHKGDMYCAVFTPDGQRIVTGAGFGRPGISPGEAKVWDAATGHPLFDLQGHNYSVWAVAVSPDGRRIATASGELSYRASEVKVWDAATGQELLTLSFTDNVRCVSFSPDSQRLVTGDHRGAVETWSASSGEKLLTFKAQANVITSVTFSPDGQRILSSSWDRTARISEAATGREILVLKGHANAIHSAAFSPDGGRVVTGSWDQTAKIWNAETAQEIFTLKGHSAYVRSVAFSPGGKYLATGSDDKVAKIWDAERGQEIPTLNGHREWVNGIAFRPDGKRLVTGSDDGTAKVWDAETGRQVLPLRHRNPAAHVGRVWSVAFSPDGRRIVTGGDDKLAKVWDAETGQALFALEHTNCVLGVAFSPDGHRIVTGVGWYGERREGEVKLWDAASGRLQFTLQPTQSAWSVAFSPDSKRIASDSGREAVEVWDATTGREVFALRGHKGGVCGIAFSPNGQRIVTASRDRTAKVWDASTGQELLTLKGHTDRVLAVAISPDGQRIVTGGADQTVRIWEAATGQEVFAFKGQSENDLVRCVAFSPDGQHVVAGTGPPVTVRMWSTAPAR